MLDIRGLSFGYRQADNPTLENVDLRVGQGEFVSLIGPSGCGKSTLLRVVMGLQQAQAGTVQLQLDRRDIGFLFQNNALLPWCTAQDNVALGLRAHGMRKHQARQEAKRWLDSVGLAGFGQRYPRELSGGQQKRVAIAQVLALRPRLLLMDEPFASLDAILRRYITEDLLRWVEREKLTVLMVTHDLDEAVAVSDRVVMLSNGPRAHVKGLFEVPMARPRDLGRVRQDPAYAPLVSRLWNALSGEIQVPHAVPGPVLVAAA